MDVVPADGTGAPLPSLPLQPAVNANAMASVSTEYLRTLLIILKRPFSPQDILTEAHNRSFSGRCQGRCFYAEQYALS
jgi:hypothetical protein